MAKSQTIARLGVQLALDDAEFKSGASNAVVESKNLRNSIAREMRAAEKEVQTLKYATEDYGKTVTRVAQLEREIEAGRFKNLKGDAAGQQVLARLRAQAQAYDDIAKKSRTAATATGLTSQQQLQLTYQTTDLVTQIASGQNAMIALLQQGGQLKDSMGGFAGMFRAIGTLMTPFNVGMAAVAATVGTLGFAFYKGAQESAKFRDDMILTGGYAGMTQKSFLDLADTLSNKTNLSIGETKNILGQLISSGKFTSESIGSVATAISRVAELSGDSAEQVAQKLIPSFNGSASSAKSLNDSMHFLTLQQFKYIQQLEKQGRQQEAIKATADALAEKLSAQKRNLGALESAWYALGKAASAAWDFMLGIGRAEDINSKIDRLAKQVGQRALHLQVRTSQGAPKEMLADLQKQLLADQDELRKAVIERDTKNAQEEAARKETEAINIEEQVGKARLQIQDKVQDQLAKNRFDAERYEAIEYIRINLEADEKLDQARKERDRGNRDNPLLAGQNNALFAAKQQGIELEKNNKLRTYANQLSDKAKNALLEEANEFDKYQNDYAEYLNKLNEAQAIKSVGLINDQEMLDLFKRRYTMTEQEFSLEQQILQIRQQQRDAIAEINKMSLSPEDRERALKRENDYWAKRLSMAKELAKVTGRKTGSGKEGFMSSFSEAMQNLPNEFEQGAKAFDSLMGNMNASLENFVRTGKLSFKDFARSVIQDLLLIQLKIAAMKLLEAVLGNFGFSLPARAMGGPVESGQMYLVGEKGPEMFIPRSSGTIIPNDRISSGGGATTNVTNYNIQAIDVKSFEDRIMGSSTAVWAANMYAQKRLPVGSGRM